MLTVFSLMNSWRAIRRLVAPAQMQFEDVALAVGQVARGAAVRCAGAAASADISRVRGASAVISRRNGSAPSLVAIA